MLNLRSAYYYFLATKINITKKLKKIYFRTNFYNNSLISKVPEQLYFYPNPFLLSSLTSHKNFSFKVSNIDPDMFWVKQSNEKEEKNLHNFLWLNLINRKNKDSIIQKIINVWIYKNNKYKNIIWDSAVVSKRIISWILNADIILNNTDNSFKNDFFKSIILQTNHLRKNIKFENDNCKKIEIISAILLTGLVFKDYSENYDFGIKELEKIIEIFFDNEGFPLNKNPNDLIKFSKYLILIKECIKDAQQFVPDYLDATIEKNLKCLKSIVTPHNQIPLFNGGTEINLEEYFDYISKLNYRFSKSLRKIGNLQMWEYLIHTLKGQKVFIDTDSEFIIKKTKKKFPWVKAYSRDKKFIELEKNKKASPIFIIELSFNSILLNRLLRPTALKTDKEN